MLLIKFLQCVYIFMWATYRTKSSFKLDLFVTLFLISRISLSYILATHLQIWVIFYNLKLWSTRKYFRNDIFSVKFLYFADFRCLAVFLQDTSKQNIKYKNLFPFFAHICKKCHFYCDNLCSTDIFIFT